MDNNTLHNAIFFIAASACGIGQFLDCHTTDVGLIKGYIEANSFAGRMYRKIGPTGLFVVKCMVIPMIGAGLFTAVGFGLSLAWLLPMAAIGFVAGIQNYRLLKKNKVSVF